MRPVIFCNIAYMKYYRGIINGVDEPENGGKYVKEQKDAHESYNFDIVTDKEGKNYLLGFVMTNSDFGRIAIEKIIGCQALEKENFADGVTVVWCARSRRSGGTRVVGWYNNATVYREQQCVVFQNGYEQGYNFVAEAEDCVLLPESERFRYQWDFPRSGHNGYNFGFGRANVWYASGNDSRMTTFIDRILSQIDNYDGKNLMTEEDLK